MKMTLHESMHHAMHARYSYQLASKVRSKDLLIFGLACPNSIAHQRCLRSVHGSVSCDEVSGDTLTEMCDVSMNMHVHEP